MKLNFGGLPLDDVLSNKDLRVSIEEDLIVLERKVGLLNALCGLTGNEVGLEGIVTDVVKTATWTAPRAIAKGGSKIYKQANIQHRQLKSKWNKTIKPLIIKTIKEMGNALQNIYFKFSKFEEKYVNLGKKIDYVLTHQLRQIGALTQEKFFIHPLRANVLKGYTVIIDDYGEFYKATVDVMVPDWLNAKDVSRCMKSGDLNKLKGGTTALTNAIEKVNEFGDITIPWTVFKDKRYNTFFSRIFSRKPTSNQMKSSLSGYVKSTILEDEYEYEYNVKGRKEFIEEVGKHLKIVASVLNNNVLNRALKGGGDSLKKQTKEFFTEIEGLSKVAIVIPESKAKKTNDDGKDDEQIAVSKEDMLNTELEGYMSNSLTLLTKTSTAYTGIVRGSLSALFTIVTEAEEICGIIEASVDAKEMK